MKKVKSLDHGKYKGKLLIAMATDANNEVYLLAFAVVESESKETWGWFLECLTRFVTDQNNLSIISDRHSGIKAYSDDKSMTWLQLLRSITSTTSAM
ncbi:hypothetical protein SO802_017787 [Lithocarpus litseifolius]|uniref:MULE transposase domain-containing protein n=1 Tax=Lithocarpus litseifolius TaxID=425828 RepID=A0AAW2CIZ2_9ROSI